MTSDGPRQAGHDPGQGLVQPLDLTVNGATVSVDCDEDATLLAVLRDQLGLTSVRFGCGEEQCGACVVIIDGRATFSCTLAAAAAAGRSVETAESLSPSDPLSVAFLDHQAGQCGFCLTGILMAATALLRAVPQPTRAQVQDALQVHLCRCGSHQRILDAILSVGRQ